MKFVGLFQGYVIYSVRKKLKKQYIHLKGKQIEKLKKSGVEVCNLGKTAKQWPNSLILGIYLTSNVPLQITDLVLSPEVAFTGDTTAEYMLDPRNADALRAKILITEVWTEQNLFHLLSLLAVC